MGKNRLIDGSILVADWFNTIDDFGGLCAYCLVNPYQVLEHFIPRSKRGKTVAENCLPACVACNRKKLDLVGGALVAIFGIDTISRLQEYLLQKSDQPSVLLGMWQDLAELKETYRGKKGPRIIVKEIARAQGINQKDLALESGVTVQLLSRYWNNHVQRVDLDELAKIAKVLGMKTGDLIVDDEAA